MSQDRYRDVVAVAVTIALIGLGVYFLSDSHSAASYTNTGAESRTAANSCTRPKAVPMNPGNPQSGVTSGNYYVTNDSWNAQHYSGLSQTLSSAITITGAPFPP